MEPLEGSVLSEGADEHSSKSIHDKKNIGSLSPLHYRSLLYRDVELNSALSLFMATEREKNED